MQLAFLTAILALALRVFADEVPNNQGNAANQSIPFVTDPVLEAVAANPPANTSTALMTFTQGIIQLPGSFFRFTELPGTDDANHTTVITTFAFPKNLSSTNNIFMFHVHVNPVTAGDNTCESAGGHFDPFKANGSEALVNPPPPTEPVNFSPAYNPNPGNLSRFQLGDLAGKYGVLTTIDGEVPQRTIRDHYLRLTGNLSIVGRSVVVHDQPTNTRLACGNITLVSSS